MLGYCLKIIWSFLSLKGGCTGSFESTPVKMPHCWKSHVRAQMGFLLETNKSMFVILDSQETADEAAFMVQVTYTNIQPPILTLDDAIQKQSTFPTPFLPPAIVGNPQR